MLDMPGRLPFGKGKPLGHLNGHDHRREEPTVAFVATHPTGIQIENARSGRLGGGPAGRPARLHLRQPQRFNCAQAQAHRHLEPVNWHFDHVESTPYKPRRVNGLAYLGCNMWIGGRPVTFDVRLNLHEKTVRRINRRRDGTKRISFLSKDHFARHVLHTLQPLLPNDLPVYVVHDAWYGSAQLMQATHRYGWHTITAIKHNRKLVGWSSAKSNQTIREPLIETAVCARARSRKE